MKAGAIRKVAIAGVVVAIGSGTAASAVAARQTDVTPKNCVLSNPQDVTAATSGTLSAHRIIPLCN